MDDDKIKQQYFKEQLETGIRAIFSAQQKIAATRIYRERRTKGRAKQRSRSGALMEALNSQQYTVEPYMGGVRANVTLPIYIRFLDMRKYGNYKIYNRPVWGILYRQTLNNIKYEYRDWLRDHFGEILVT